MPRPLTLSILLLSAAALAYEVLLLRLFSIAQWHHFAYMVISLALLGYGASGTFLALARRPLLRRFPAAFLANVLLFAAASVGTFTLAQRLPFNPLELAWDPRQMGYLAAAYLLLSLPFFGAANAIGLALARFEEGLHRVYAADLLGAGLGAAGVVGLLFWLPPGPCLEAISALGLAAAALALADGAWGRRRIAAALGLGVAALSPVLWPDAWSEPRVSPFKGLAQALRVPGGRVMEERSGPLGLLSVVESPRIPFRHAPGLSLGFSEEPPEQLGLFTDADSLTAITRFEGDLEMVRYLDSLPSALPYHLLERPRVLVVGAGGGSQVLSALYHGAREVDALEVNRQLARLVAEDYAPFAGHLYDRPGVRLHLAEARGYLARTEARFDLIQLDLVDSFAAAAAGAHALSESYLYTVEALEQDLDHLAPGGLLAVTRWLSTPPRDVLKLFATAVAALEADALEADEDADPGRRLALIRGWSTATLLVKNGAFTAEDVEAIRAFAEERSFDVAYFPGITPEEVNRFNLLDEPYLYQGARALLGPERQRYLAAYKFYIDPATDERPYFFRFFKWRVLPELLALRGRGSTPLIQWSYLILAATLGQAVLAGALLVLAPLALARRRVLAAPGAGRMVLYFLALGVAFLFVEIALLHRFTLFLAHPLYSAAVVLGSFLLFAGLGSAASRRLVARGEGRRENRADSGAKRAAVRSLLPVAGWPALGAALLTLIYVAALPPLFRTWAGLPDPARIALSAALLAPLAFLMGMPFPLGLARTARRNLDWLPWAWGVNGCASVVSAVGATLLALHAGFAAVLAVAAALYLGAAWLVGRL